MDLIYIVSIWLLPVLIAITFHEAAHGYVARFLGDETQDRRHFRFDDLPRARPAFAHQSAAKTRRGLIRFHATELNRPFSAERRGLLRRRSRA